MLRRLHIPFMLVILLLGVGYIQKHQGTRQEATLKWLASHPYVIAALKGHNRIAAQWPPETLQRRDREWLDEKADKRPPALIGRVMRTPLSRWLAAQVAKSNRQMEQIMVTGANGALVAADHVTHDYDQSDEPKWQQTVGKGNRAMVLEGRAQASRGIRSQQSLAVVDGGRIIGAVTLLWCDTAGGCG